MDINDIAEILDANIRYNNGLIIEYTKGVQEFGGVYVGKVGLFKIFYNTNFIKSISTNNNIDQYFKSLCDKASHLLRSINCNSTFNVLVANMGDVDLSGLDGVYFRKKHIIVISSSMLDDEHHTLHVLIHETAHQIFDQLPKSDKVEIRNYFYNNIVSPDAMGVLTQYEADQKDEKFRVRIDKYTDDDLYNILMRMLINEGCKKNKPHDDINRYGLKHMRQVMIDIIIHVCDYFYFNLNIDIRAPMFNKLTQEIINKNDYLIPMHDWFMANIRNFNIFSPSVESALMDDPYIKTDDERKEYEKKRGIERQDSPTTYGTTNSEELFAELIASNLTGKNRDRFSKLDELYRYIIRFVR
jgi:hypothetical protein